jgi:hypothetical protein
VNFVVLRNVPGQIFPFTDAQARAAFGRPAHVYHVTGYTIMAWDKNLLRELGPPAAN